MTRAWLIMSMMLSGCTMLIGTEQEERPAAGTPASDPPDLGESHRPRGASPPPSSSPSPSPQAEPSASPSPSPPSSSSPNGTPHAGPSTVAEVPTTSFLRRNNPLLPAQVTGFRLDKNEITVARFRQFVDEGLGTRMSPPPAGAGRVHGRPETGWNPDWNNELISDTAALRVRLQLGQDDHPVTNITWFEAFAFCIWDGGRLPTQAEYDVAALGGDEQRVFPWSSPPTSEEIDSSRAVVSPPQSAQMQPVGSKPAGAGRWGHRDLVGNAAEWLFDSSPAFQMPCLDCARVGGAGVPRMFALGPAYLETDFRGDAGLFGASPQYRVEYFGARCAYE